MEREVHGWMEGTNRIKRMCHMKNNIMGKCYNNINAQFEYLIWNFCHLTLPWHELKMIRKNVQAYSKLVIAVSHEMFEDLCKGLKLVNRKLCYHMLLSMSRSLLFFLGIYGGTHGLMQAIPTSLRKLFHTEVLWPHALPFVLTAITC